MAEHVGRLEAPVLIGVGAALDWERSCGSSPPFWGRILAPESRRNCSPPFSFAGREGWRRPAGAVGWWYPGGQRSLVRSAGEKRGT